MWKRSDLGFLEWKEISKILKDRFCSMIPAEGTGDSSLKSSIFMRINSNFCKLEQNAEILSMREHVIWQSINFSDKMFEPSVCQNVFKRFSEKLKP